MKTLKINWGWIVLAILIATFIKNQFNLFTDDSDKNGWNRSGLSVRVDHATGVNYFVTAGFFGIGQSVTPRLTTNGSLYITKP